MLTASVSQPERPQSDLPKGANEKKSSILTPTLGRTNNHGEDVAIGPRQYRSFEELLEMHLSQAAESSSTTAEDQARNNLSAVIIPVVPPSTSENYDLSMASADRYDAKYDKGGNEEVGFFDSEEQQQQQEYGQHEFEEDYDVEDDEDEINSSRLIHPRDIEQYPQYHHHSSEEGAADVNTNEEENSDDSEVGLDGDVDSLKEKHRTEWQSLQNQEMNSLAEFEEIERGIICNMQQEEVPASDDSLHPLHALAAVGNDTSERAYMEDEVIVVKNNINNAHCGFIETEEEEQEDAVVLETTTSHLHHQHQRRRSNLFDESQNFDFDSKMWGTVASPITSNSKKNLSTLFSEFDGNSSDDLYGIANESRLSHLNHATITTTHEDATQANNSVSTTSSREDILLPIVYHQHSASNSPLTSELKASLEEKIKNLEQTVQSLKFQAQLKDKKAETASTTTTNPTTNLAFKKLQIEREQFEKYRVDQVSKIEAMREDEMKRLRREKLAWEKQRKAGEILPSKKERVEIESLKQSIMSLQEETKRQSSRWQMSQDRMKKRIDSLQKRNGELEDEVRVLEVSRAGFIEEKKTLEAMLIKLQTAFDSSKKQQSQVGTSSAAASKSNASSSSATQIPTPTKTVKYASIMATAAPPSSKMATRAIPVSLSSNSRLEADISASAPTPPQPPASLVVTSLPDPSQQTLDKLEASLDLPHAFQEKMYDGKRERIYPKQFGVTLVWYRNGTTKEARADGSYMIRFVNGDYKKVDASRTTIYWFSETNTFQTTYPPPNGLVVHQFESGQIEKSFPNGKLEILFPDGTFKTVHPNGEEESTFPDGTIQKVDVVGQRTVEYADGTKEFFLNGLKKKILTDGTVKMVYLDGTQETRYADGRIRIKDKNGRLLRDQ